MTVSFKYCNKIIANAELSMIPYAKELIFIDEVEDKNV